MNTNQHRRTVLAVALEAAIEAGRNIRLRVDEEKQVKSKSSPADLVTNVDSECERLIRERVLHTFPDHCILGEESTEPGVEASIHAASQLARSQSLWIVDPIDGTTNFVQRLPLSTVSIGYAEAGELTVGVVFDPYRDDIFLAIREYGTFQATSVEALDWAQYQKPLLPGIKLETSTTTVLEESILATDSPPYQQLNQKFEIASISRIMRRVRGVRSLGSAALHLAYVASGRLDGFWESDLNVWDLAAGVLLVQEAGGHVQTIDGYPYSLTDRNVIACGTAPLSAAVEAILRTLVD